LQAVIGSPFIRPIINAEESNRVFHVKRGVTLDVRHLMMYEGDGDYYVRGVSQECSQLAQEIFGFSPP
jgi:hypothetical protein